MTESPQDAPKPITRVPREHMRSFLAFCIAKEPAELDAEEQKFAALVRELAVALDRDLDDPLAWAVIDAVGADDLTDPSVSRLYADWAAHKLLEA